MYRFLVVDDSQSDVWLLREAIRLAQLPAHLAVAHDGIEALRFLNQVHCTESPDLVLLDLNLPRKNGHRVLAEIKSSRELRAIPVVVLSSSSDEEDRRRAYELGACSFITKPSSLPAYLEMVQTFSKFSRNRAGLRQTA